VEVIPPLSIGLYREMSRLSGSHVLGLGTFFVMVHLTPRIPRTIIIRRARRPPSRGVVIPSLGVIMPYMGLYYLLTERGAPSPIRQHTTRNIWDRPTIHTLVGLGAHPLGGGGLYLHWGFHIFYGMVSTTIREGGVPYPFRIHQHNLTSTEILYFH